jgi:hypothetical protein
LGNKKRADKTVSPLYFNTYSINNPFPFHRLALPEQQQILVLACLLPHIL